MLNVDHQALQQTVMVLYGCMDLYGLSYFAELGMQTCDSQCRQPLSGSVALSLGQDVGFVGSWFWYNIAVSHWVASFCISDCFKCAVGCPTQWWTETLRVSNYAKPSIGDHCFVVIVDMKSETGAGLTVLFILADLQVIHDWGLWVPFFETWVW